MRYFQNCLADLIPGCSFTLQDRTTLKAVLQSTFSPILPMLSLCTYRRTLVWLLVLAIARVPVPWAHSHEVLSRGEVTSHVEAYHLGVVEWELPSGWHIHWYCYGQQHQGDGLHSQSSSADLVLAEAEDSFLDIELESRWQACVNTCGQHASAWSSTIPLAQLSRLVVPFRAQSALGQSSAERCVRLGVLQI